MPEPLTLLLLEVTPAVDAATIVAPVRVVPVDDDARVRAERLHLARARDVVGDARLSSRWWRARTLGGTRP
eukprot:6024516-Prymnesium_polylepis.1